MGVVNAINRIRTDEREHPLKEVYIKKVTIKD